MCIEPLRGSDSWGEFCTSMRFTHGYSHLPAAGRFNCFAVGLKKIKLCVSFWIRKTLKGLNVINHRWNLWMKSKINDLTTPKGLNQNKQTLMSTYGHALYQIVFSTKYRERTLVKSDRDKLFRYMWGVLEHKKCHLYRLGGVEDHIHIIVNIHPTNSVSNLIKDIQS